MPHYCRNRPLHGLSLWFVLIAGLNESCSIVRAGGALQRLEPCVATAGDWCQSYHADKPVKASPTVLGELDCPGDCNGVGTCDAVTGACTCTAGWTGADCTQPKKRPCANMGPDKRDKGWLQNRNWYWTRCAGICDDDTATCYCPPGTKYGYAGDLGDARADMQRKRRARPLTNCNPTGDEADNDVVWGQVPYDDVFGPKGWCNAEIATCDCHVDGLVGMFCDVPVEQTCLNQCSGHGECLHGFCLCHKGYFGVECGQRKQGVPQQAGMEASSRPWIREHVQPVPVSQGDVVWPARRRPYIYVYELPPEFNSRLLQYRLQRGSCTYREFVKENSTKSTSWRYGVEQVLHESMLLSPHRTLDSSEADFFYVPAYTSCLHEVHGKSSQPRWPDVDGAEEISRPNAAHNMLQAVQAWIAKEFNHVWQRRGGRDHIWLMSHDEGACYAPSEIWPGIMLTHWGRTDFPHASHSPFWQDTYSTDLVTDWQPKGWLAGSSKSHPCFDLQKDLVIPSLVNPVHVESSPFLNFRHMERNIFLFFRGDLRTEHGMNGETECKGSKCIRQKLAALVQDGDWASKYKVMIGSPMDIQGDPSYLMSQAIFCLHLPGRGWRQRFEEAILHGCIPVAVMDSMVLPFHGVVELDQISVHIQESQLPSIMTLLRAMPKHQIAAMQKSISMVWHRFRYNGPGYLKRAAHTIEESNLQERSTQNRGDVATTPGAERLHTPEDAVTTIIQWLHSRMGE